MHIVIEQRKLGFRSEYNISGFTLGYRATKKLFSFLAKFQVFGNDGRVVARIRSRFYLFRPRYDFELSEGGIYHFRSEKFWKGVYACESGRETLHLYKHKGLKYSVFKNESQIAAFTKNRLKIGKGDKYDLRFNSDANPVLIICLALTVDAMEYEDDDATVTYDFGNIGPQERAYNESWEPS